MTIEPRAQVTFQWGQTHRRLLRDPLVGDKTLWNRAINVGTGISQANQTSALTDRPLTQLSNSVWLVL